MNVKLHEVATGMWNWNADRNCLRIGRLHGKIVPTLSIVSGTSGAESAAQRAGENHGEELDDEQNDTDSNDNFSHWLQLVGDNGVAVGLEFVSSFKIIEIECGNWIFRRVLKFLRTNLSTVESPISGLEGIEEIFR